VARLLMHLFMRRRHDGHDGYRESGLVNAQALKALS
jgi:hypothetical protein